MKYTIIAISSFDHHDVTSNLTSVEQVSAKLAEIAQRVDRPKEVYVIESEGEHSMGNHFSTDEIDQAATVMLELGQDVGPLKNRGEIV